jgi:hypothetical protein
MSAPDVPPLGVAYRVYSLKANEQDTTGDDEDTASAKYAARYRVPPERIHEYCGALWLGPVPESENVSKVASECQVSNAYSAFEKQFDV